MAELLKPVAPQSWHERVATLRLQAPPWAVALAAGTLVVAVVAFLVLRPSPRPAPLTLPKAVPSGSAPGAADAPPPPAPAAAPEVVTVHVAGQVQHPGVYAVGAGGRVTDAITAAGGPLPEADLDQLNLAAKLADGDRVYVGKKGEMPPVGSAAGAVAGGTGTPTTRAGPLDLNTATAEQLDALPGVGPATAKAIVDYRTRHGRYRSVTDLLEVPGIGPAKLEALRPLVRV